MRYLSFPEVNKIVTRRQKYVFETVFWHCSQKTMFSSHASRFFYKWWTLERDSRTSSVIWYHISNHDIMSQCPQNSSHANEPFPLYFYSSISNVTYCYSIALANKATIWDFLWPQLFTTTAFNLCWTNFCGRQSLPKYIAYYAWVQTFDTLTWEIEAEYNPLFDQHASLLTV